LANLSVTNVNHTEFSFRVTYIVDTSASLLCYTIYNW